MTVPLAGIVLASTFAWFFRPELQTGGDPHNAGTNSIASVFAILSAFAFGRSMVIGVWLGEEALVVRSWFVTREFARGEMSVTGSSYWGFWTRWTESALIWNLAFADSQRPTWSARGTVAWHSTTKKQVEQIKRWVAGAADEASQYSVE